MNKRRSSPPKIRGLENLNPEMPQRELIINKLRDDLITARGKQKQFHLIRSYKLQLQEKTKQLQNQIAKEDNQFKLKIDSSNHIIFDIKKQLQQAKHQLKMLSNQRKEQDEQQAALRKKLNSKNIKIIERRKQANYLGVQNERLINQKHRLLNEEQAVIHQYQRFRQTVIRAQDQINGVRNRISNLNKQIQDEKIRQKLLIERLKKFESQNNHISETIQNKQQNLQQLNNNFSKKRQELKKQQENNIQLEYKIQKMKKQTQHKLYLLKNENEKSLEVNNRIRNIEKKQNQAFKEKTKTQEQCQQIIMAINQIEERNKRFRQDLGNCQSHLDNLFRQNVVIQQELQKYLKEDQIAISIIQRKRILPTLDYMRQLRTSRAIKQSRNTEI